MEDIQRYRNRRLTDVERNFYDAMQITVQGLSAYIARYADLAEALLKEPALGYDRSQLEHIQAACRKLAWQPAQTFPEALQMVWFLMCFVDYDSFGRLDQYLLPYYRVQPGAGHER